MSAGEADRGGNCYATREQAIAGVSHGQILNRSRMKVLGMVKISDMFLQKADSLEIKEYKKPRDWLTIARTHVSFEGSLQKHPVQPSTHSFSLRVYQLTLMPVVRLHPSYAPPSSALSAILAQVAPVCHLNLCP